MKAADTAKLAPNLSFIIANTEQNIALDAYVSNAQRVDEKGVQDIVDRLVRD